MSMDTTSRPASRSSRLVSSRAGSGIQGPRQTASAASSRARRSYIRLEPLDRALAREGSERSAEVEAHGTLPRPVVAEGARIGLEGLRQRPAPHPSPENGDEWITRQRQRAKAQPPPVPAGVR